MDPAGWWALVSSGWNDIGHTEFWIALAKIMWINILLSGDNAVVIAMACRGLPHRQRVWGMILGAGVAVGLRIIFTGVVASLMLLPYLKIVGGPRSILHCGEASRAGGSGRERSRGSRAPLACGPDRRDRRHHHEPG
jgi:hypothetical protein